MKEKDINMQVYYELAMSVGNSLDLLGMLKKALVAYVHKLDCKCGMIYQFKPGNIVIRSCEILFTVPYVQCACGNVSGADELLSRQFSHSEIEELRRILPKKDIDSEGNHYHIMELGSFGFIVLIKQDKFFSSEEIVKIMEVNERLSKACNDCIKYEELQEKQIRFNHLEEIRREMICELNTEGLVTYANRHAIEKLGYSPDDVRGGFEALNLIIPQEKDWSRESFTNYLGKDNIPPREYTLVRKDGTSFPSLVYTTPQIRNKKITGLIAMIIDISELKENENKLKQYAERLELALLGSDAGLWDWNILTGEVYFSERWCSMLGYGISEIKPNISSWSEHVHPDDLPLVNEVLNKHLEGKLALYQTEHRVRTKNGEWKWILDTGKVTLRDQDGKPLRAVGTHIDITSKKESEEKIIQDFRQQELLSEIALKLNSLSDFETKMNSVLGKIGTHLNINRVYIIEKAPEKMSPGKSFEWCNKDVVPVKDSQHDSLYKKIPSLENTLIDKGYFQYDDFSVLPSGPSSGTENNNNKQVIIFPLFVLGKYYGYIGFDQYTSNRKWSKSELELLRTFSGIISNAIERRIMELSIIQERDKANEASRAKTEFLANMSHEIRTPMNAILGFSESLYNKLESEKQKKMLKSVLSSGNLLMSLLNDILDLSKIEAGMLELFPRETDLRIILQDISQLFTDKAIKKNIEISLNVSQDFPGTILVDEIRVKQVLFNLVGNAVKFTHKGKVDIRVYFEFTSKSTGTLTMEVEDTGIGIPESQHGLIFEAFRQMEGQSNRTYGGAGLGLAISRRLVEKMGGRMSLLSQEGQGSVFTVVIDNISVVSMKQEDKSPEPNSNEMVFEPSLILIVDDIQLNIDAIESLLSEQPVTILKANSGEAAFGLLKETRPDLILLDIRMPGSNGYEVAAHIKSDPSLKNIPVIAYTASVFNIDKIEKSGIFDSYLVKPVSNARLMSLLTSYLKFSVEVNSSQVKEPVLETLDELPAEVMSAFPLFIDIMRRDILPKWEVIKDQVLLYVIEDFAVELKKLADSYNFRYLANFADRIIEDLEIVDLEGLSESIGKFPKIVKQIYSLGNTNLILNK
jgi:PAS domain S-box-containing protein